MYIIKYARSYQEDLNSSLKYIRSNLQNPIAAKKLKEEVINKCKKIKENPLFYPAVSDKYLSSKGYRFLLVNNYMIFFKVKEKEIEVIRFLYGYRDWMNILEKDNWKIISKCQTHHGGRRYMPYCF